MMNIAEEAPSQFDAIRRLTIDAFAASEFGHNGEADLVDAIRDRCENKLSLVAIDHNHVVGHILFSPATIRTKLEVVDGMALAPMSVLPEKQARGIGAALVREGLRRIAETDAAFIIVAGHRGYYPRLGFESAMKYSITHGFAGMPQDIFFIQIPNSGVREALKHGRAYYHPVFGPQYADH